MPGQSIWIGFGAVASVTIVPLAPALHTAVLVGQASASGGAAWPRMSWCTDSASFTASSPGYGGTEKAKCLDVFGKVFGPKQ